MASLREIYRRFTRPPARRIVYGDDLVSAFVLEVAAAEVRSRDGLDAVK